MTDPNKAPTEIEALVAAWRGRAMITSDPGVARAYGDCADRLADALQSATAGREIAWLIEAPGARYLEAYPMANQWWFRWTQDPNKAVRFVLKDQADCTMMAVRRLAPDLFAFAVSLGDPVPSEHVFLALQTPPRQEQSASEPGVSEQTSEQPDSGLATTESRLSPNSAEGAAAGGASSPIPREGDGQ